jgi:hypothetical protein
MEYQTNRAHMAGSLVNRKMRPIEATLLSAGSLMGVRDDLCLDAVTADGRRVFVTISEAQSEQLVITLSRAIHQGFWGDSVPNGIIIPHSEPLGLGPMHVQSGYSSEGPEYDVPTA